MEIVFDIEATGLLDSSTIDYTCSPYKLKPDFKVHCIVAKDRGTGDKYHFVGNEVKSKFKTFLREKKVTKIIGHNIINYDLLIMKLYSGIDYSIGYDKSDTVDGLDIEIVDTLVLSKVMNPDRPAHGIEYWGRLLGLEKIDWRAKAVEIGLITADAPKGAEFLKYHPEMLAYNERDVDVNDKVYNAQLKEMGDWDWSDAFKLESLVAELITRQTHRGFKFDKESALNHVRELDILMENIKTVVDPLIPPKPLGKTKMKDYTPPLKQFLKSGEPNAHIKNFIEKHNGSLVFDDKWKATVLGKTYTLPIKNEPIVTHEPATVNDVTHLKGWLVSLGWKATQYKERDLTVDFKKKKLTREKFEEVIEKYAEQTLNSPFCQDRLDELGCTRSGLKAKLRKHDITRPLKVYTNPTLTVGMEKEIDPTLLEMTDKFPHAKLVSEYLTYKHRRNSILGGGVDPDDEDEEAEKGFLSADRINVDGRIPTPADTCGAGTSRFKHRLVANIPRTTSLYGENMRGLFGADVEGGMLQLGYDFDSLEAKVESHYVYKYPGGKEYGVSLTAEKPNDCHTVLAAYISKLLNRTFNRGPAKNVKYGASYNAQPPRLAKTVGCSLSDGQIIFDAFWVLAAPLKLLKEKMQTYWETTGKKKFLLGIDGRKLPIRSKGNVINTAFQSTGVICAKRAMVIHDQKLKAEGFTVDFFREDWKNKKFVQQMIAYHDEAQLEISRSFVTFKKFDTEDEAKAFICPEGKKWSDVIHNDKGWFRAYCRAGELASEAVKEAGEYYKLNVELTAGYIIGRNWKECH